MKEKSGNFVFQHSQVIPKGAIRSLLGLTPTKFRAVSVDKLSRWQSEAILGLCKIWPLQMTQFEY
tara:strand:- start:373 stop:567 length:195 start_codon:yes stop_codon:yes gene_type:complete